MSISAFAVNRIGRAENETTQSVQMTDNQKGEAAATRQKSSEAQTKTRQENMKKSDSESKTKDNSEEQKKDSKDADNKGAKENSTEKDAKEDSEKNISKEEKSTKEEKNTEKKSEETTDVSEATTTAAKETTTEAAEKKTEAVTEKTPEGKDSKEATSEEKAEEETQAEDDKNKEIAVTSISGPTEVQVGKTIRLTGTSGSYGYSHSWSSSNKNIATVTGNGSTAEVKGVAVGTVTITHRYSSQWNGNTRTETYQVKVTKFADNYSGEAAIYYLANPAGDPWTNDTGAWAPSQDTSNTLANISTSGATWEDGHVDDIVYENKNRQIEDLTVNDLPYNLNDDYIEVNDMDYGIFCMHIMENPQIYEDKTIKIKGKVIGRDKLIENGFVLGRQAMVCCSDDMQLLGLVCISKYAKDLIKDEWLVVDGTISLEYDESIQSNIPILHVDHLEGAKPLENEYVTFD